MSRAWTALVIEDDPQFRLTLTAYLEDSGYTVFEAADGLEGLEFFTRARPDIVLTDLRMPKLDGSEPLMMELKERIKEPGT